MKSVYSNAFIIYLVVFSIFLVPTFFYNYTFSDEGTHLLLSVFYKDLISNIPKIGLSYSNLYDFSINYLVHYPKLQIAYPPVYHLTNAFVFFLSSPSIVVARMVNLIYALLAFSVFYILLKKHFNEKTAFISTIFFSLSSYSLLYASRAFQDFSAYFSILLSILFFSKAFEKESKRYWLLAGISVSLAILSKQVSGILLIFFIVYIFSRKDLQLKKKINNLVILILPVIIFITPYLLLLNSVGGLEINKIVAISYAAQQGEPTNPLSPGFWLYFLIEPTVFAPLTLVFFLSLVFYIYKKEKFWKEFLIFSLIFYISLSIIPNKELRFSQLFLLPAYVSLSFYLAKIKNSKIIYSILTLYSITSILVFYPTIQGYPQEKVSNTILQNLPEGASVALFSDDEPLFSSSIISDIATKGKNKTAVIIRSCAFGNKTKEEILKTLDESNAYYIIYSAWSQDKTIDKIKDSLTLESSVSQNNLTTEIYRYKNFQNKKPERACNYICLTGEKICEK